MTAFYNRKFSMGDYKRNDEEEKARLLCHENNICITPRQSKWGEKSWIIEIETGFYPNRKKNRRKSRNLWSRRNMEKNM